MLVCLTINVLLRLCEIPSMRNSIVSKDLSTFRTVAAAWTIDNYGRRSIGKDFEVMWWLYYVIYLVHRMYIDISYN